MLGPAYNKRRPHCIYEDPDVENDTSEACFNFDIYRFNIFVFVMTTLIVQHKTCIVNSRLKFRDGFLGYLIWDLPNYLICKFGPARVTWGCGCQVALSDKDNLAKPAFTICFVFINFMLTLENVEHFTAYIDEDHELIEAIYVTCFCIFFLNN